jgi:glycosyltransferase involved in cell wall biosynthesis
MVAAFLPWHGLEFVIKAVAGFLKSTDSRLLLVGGGPETERVRQWIDELGIQSLVELTGQVQSSDVPQLIQRMDVCVIGNLAEHASPMKLFEYMGCSKAVIAPKRGPIQEILVHGINGWLFEPLDSGSLLRGVETLYHDPSLRRLLGERARETVVQNHTWDHRAREIEGWVAQRNGSTTEMQRVSVPKDTARDTIVP